jgi:hypothetical protein
MVMGGERVKDGVRVEGRKRGKLRMGKGGG